MSQLEKTKQDWYERNAIESDWRPISWGHIQKKAGNSTSLCLSLDVLAQLGDACGTEFWSEHNITKYYHEKAYYNLVSSWKRSHPS